MTQWTKIGVILALAAGAAVVRPGAADVAPAGEKPRLFEMRTYTATPGKLGDLHARFRDHANRLFARHGMAVVGCWTPTDPERGKDTLVFLLAYPDKDARDKSWREFSNDPEWKQIRDDSEKAGKLVTKVDSVFLAPADYSPLR